MVIVGGEEEEEDEGGPSHHHIFQVLDRQSSIVRVTVVSGCSDGTDDGILRSSSKEKRRTWSIQMGGREGGGEREKEKENSRRPHSKDKEVQGHHRRG